MCTCLSACIHPTCTPTEHKLEPKLAHLAMRLRVCIGAGPAMLPLESDPTTAGSMMAALLLLGALDNHGLPEALLQQAILGLRDRWRQSEP